MTKVMNAVASCGLQLYRFGETVSIPFWQDGWRPDSWYDTRSLLVNTCRQAFLFEGISLSVSANGLQGQDTEEQKSGASHALPA